MISTDSVTNLKFQIYIFFFTKYSTMFDLIFFNGSTRRKTYSQTGWSQRAPSHPSSQSQVLGWSPQVPCLHPFIFWQVLQFWPIHPSWQLKKEKKCNVNFDKFFDLENQKMKSYMQSLGLTQSPCLQSLHSAEKKLSY